MPPTGPEEGTVRAALASRQERDGLFVMMLGATDTVELAGLAKRAGQLVKLLSLKLLKGGCAMNGNGDTKKTDELITIPRKSRTRNGRLLMARYDARSGHLPRESYNP